MFIVILCFTILDSSINAPPSFKPAKKYSDISGLPVSKKFFTKLKKFLSVSCDKTTVNEMMVEYFYRRIIQIHRLSCIMLV